MSRGLRYGEELPLNGLGRVVAQCWENAENNTRASVEQKYFNPGEEQITFLFESELRAEVATNSAKGVFSNAFMKDLFAVYPQLRHIERSRIEGLIATVKFHDRSREGKTGADFGVVVTRPKIVISSGLIRIHSARRGLFVQAKLNKRRPAKSRRHAWGGITKRQKELIEEFGPHFALLIYKLEDESRKVLDQFGWQLCKSESNLIGEIKGWLKTGDFPELLSSSSVLKMLTTGSLGTTDEEVIKKFVDPPSNSRGAIEVWIYWPEGGGPGGVKIPIPLEQRARVAQSVRS